MNTTLKDAVPDAAQAERSGRGDRHRALFALDGLDFRPLELDDPIVLGRQILREVGIRDLDAHSLFLLTADGEFEDVRLDEKVDLRGQGNCRFIAFSTDPLYQAKLNDCRIVWGQAAIPEPVLRTLAGIGEDEAVFLEVRGGTDEPIARGAMVDLSASLVEKFITAPDRPRWSFYVNGTLYRSDSKKLTAAQIKAMVPGWDPTHDLALEGEGEDPDRIVSDEETIDLHPKHGVRRFSSVPKANFG